MNLLKTAILISVCLYTNSLAKEHMSQIKAFEKFEIKSQVSGIVETSKKSLESRYIKDKILLIKIVSTDENIELNSLKRIYLQQQKIVKIKEKNFNAKNRVKQLTSYEKNNEKLILLEAKKELFNLEKSIKTLENQIKKKSFFLNEKYLEEVFVKKDEYIDIGEKLYTIYDISKLKFDLFLSKEEIQGLKTKKVYINGLKTDFQVYKTHKIKDKNKVSRYKVEFIKNNDKLEEYFFDKIVKIELK